MRKINSRTKVKALHLLSQLTTKSRLDKIIDSILPNILECVAVRREGKYWGVYHMKMSRQGEREHKLNSFYVKRRAVELARDFADIMDIADVTIEEG